MADWHQRFLSLAEHIAGWSKDPSTKVGCVIIGPNREIRSTGFNGFPRGVKDSEERLHDRALKLPLMNHAEENAVSHAALIGVPLRRCFAYVTFPPCTRCARQLIQAGISDIVFPARAVVPDRWTVEVETAFRICQEADVAWVSYHAPIAPYPPKGYA